MKKVQIGKTLIYCTSLALLGIEFAGCGSSSPSGAGVPIPVSTARPVASAVTLPVTSLYGTTWRQITPSESGKMKSTRSLTFMADSITLRNDCKEGTYVAAATVTVPGTVVNGILNINGTQINMGLFDLRADSTTCTADLSIASVPFTVTGYTIGSTMTLSKLPSDSAALTLTRVY